MLLSVTGNLLTFRGKTYACAVGMGGIVEALRKQEGDGCTPAGAYPLRECWYRPDRLATPPATGLKLRAITPQDGWCDDPAHPLYNRHVTLPFTASRETLWREDGAYDLIVPIGYNDNPVIPGKGSAIFLHCMKPEGAPTEGCVALDKNNLLTLLPQLNMDTRIEICK
jgi:L,D-peptidoglycan transpeptidase YkuD (ErfK/YbiS/YcfS/YnhG family)